MNERQFQRQIRQLKKSHRTAMMAPDGGQLFEDKVPEEFLTPYADETLRASEALGVQKRYQVRSGNLTRCWSRVQLFTPELMYGSAPKRIFELSTAHAGMLEIYRHFGHEVQANDFALAPEDVTPGVGNIYRPIQRRLDFHAQEGALDETGAPTWPYKAIISELGIPIRIFDAGRVPYPLADKSQDYLLCFQALGHYGHPGEWKTLVDEFCRIATTGIVILLNPPALAGTRDRDYMRAFDEARMMLRTYNDNGFRCTSVHMNWNRALGFKLMAV